MEANHESKGNKELSIWKILRKRAEAMKEQRMKVTFNIAVFSIRESNSN